MTGPRLSNLTNYSHFQTIAEPFQSSSHPPIHPQLSCIVAIHLPSVLKSSNYRLLGDAAIPLTFRGFMAGNLKRRWSRFEEVRYSNVSYETLPFFVLLSLRKLIVWTISREIKWHDSFIEHKINSQIVMEFKVKSR